MFELIFIISVCCYFLFSAWIITGVQKKFPQISSENLPSATVIVAARNEEENILNNLKSLDELIYPEDKLEIIIVDDYSSDKTGEIIDNFISGKSKFKKILPEKESVKLKGKTAAIASAIKKSSGEIILTTDADCIVPPNWVSEITKYYQPDIGVVNGFTTQKANNYFSGMQAIDFIYLLTVSSGTINNNLPISCIGNNMSFRRKAYEETGGYESLPFSVTEDYALLMAIKNLKKYKIIFPLNPEALVVSEPCKNIKELFHQKKRWAFGGMKLPFAAYLILSAAFVSNLSVLITPLFFSVVWLYLAVFKISIDLFLLTQVHKSFQLEKKIKYFPAFELYYILYVTVLPFILMFSRKVIWKGREYFGH